MLGGRKLRGSAAPFPLVTDETLSSRARAALSAHRIPVLAGRDVIPVRQVAVGQSRGKRVPSTSRVHNMLHLDAIDELLRGPARAVPVEGHAAALVESHAYRPDTVVQAVMRQTTQFFGTQLRRVSRQLR